MSKSHKDELAKDSEKEKQETALEMNPCTKCKAKKFKICMCPKGSGEGSDSSAVGSTDDKNEKNELGAPESLEREALAKMSFDAFDKDYCRKLAASGKYEEAAIAGTNYLSDVTDLNSYQKCLQHWHVGQSYAMCGKNDLAIKHFNLAGEYTDEMTKIFGPAANSYYKATVAFLNKDTELVRHHLQHAMTVPIRAYPQSNVILVPGRINDMYKHPEISYGAIFQMKPTLPPLPGESNWYEINAKDMNEEAKMVAIYRDTLESILTDQQSQRSGPLLPKPNIISRPASTALDFPRAKQNNASAVPKIMDNENDNNSQTSLPTPFKNPFNTRLEKK